MQKISGVKGGVGLFLWISIIGLIAIIAGFMSWTHFRKKASQATPEQISQTNEGLTFIKKMYAGYTAVSNDYSRQPVADRDANLSPYLTADLLKKVDSVHDYDAVVCTYGKLPTSISYDTPFLSATTDNSRDSVVVNVTFHSADGAPSTSAGVFYNPQIKKITAISCTGHSI